MDILRVQKSMLKKAGEFPSSTYGFSPRTQPAAPQQPKQPTSTPVSGNIFDTKKFFNHDQSTLPVWQRDQRPDQNRYNGDSAAFDYDMDRWKAWHSGSYPQTIMQKLPDARPNVAHDGDYDFEDMQTRWQQMKQYHDNDWSGVSPEMRPYIHDSKSLQIARNYNPTVNQPPPTTNQWEAWKEGLSEGVWDTRLAASKQMGDFAARAATLPQDVVLGLPEMAWDFAANEIPARWHQYVTRDPHKFYEARKRQADFRQNGWLPTLHRELNSPYENLNQKFQANVDQQYRFNPEKTKDYENAAKMAWLPAYLARDVATFGGTTGMNLLASVPTTLEATDAQGKANAAFEWLAKNMSGGIKDVEQNMSYMDPMQLAQFYEENNIPWYVDNFGKVRMTRQEQEPSIVLDHPEYRNEPPHILPMPTMNPPIKPEESDMRNAGGQGQRPIMSYDRDTGQWRDIRAYGQ